MTAERSLLEVAWRTTGRLVRPQVGKAPAVVTDVYRCDAERQRQLTRLGFSAYRVWDTIAWRGLRRDLPTTTLPPGFTLRPATLADAGGLAAVRNDAFRGTWTAAGYRERVMRRPGYDPQRELLVAAPDGRVAALTVFWLDDVNLAGLFEPVATHSAFRRLGLARALLAFGLLQMRERGMTAATVGYNADNKVAGALYRGLGFVPRDETLGYRRVVSSAN